MLIPRPIASLPVLVSCLSLASRCSSPCSPPLCVSLDVSQGLVDQRGSAARRRAGGSRWHWGEGREEQAHRERVRGAVELGEGRQRPRQGAGVGAARAGGAAEGGRREGQPGRAANGSQALPGGEKRRAGAVQPADGKAGGARRKAGRGGRERGDPKDAGGQSRGEGGKDR
eukprot:768385-Hanusia_phi.AAC.1